MENTDFDTDKLIRFWIESSDEDYETMITLYDNKRLSWSMFLGHLMIEKLLKALYVKLKNDYPPYIHNLSNRINILSHSNCHFKLKFYFLLHIEAHSIFA